MKSRLPVAIVIIASLLLSSCALVFKGEESSVNFDTKPAGAEVLINGVSYGTTPVDVKLKSDTTYKVTLRQGDQEHTVMLTNNIGTLWIVLDVLTGLVPLIVDAATGAWYNLEPGQVYYEFN